MQDLILRDYQESQVQATREALRVFRNVMLQCPTGGGKTAMATRMLQNAAAKQARGFFICHRRELIDQTAMTFDKFGVPYGYIASGYPTNFFSPIQICSIDTLKNRFESVPAPKVCIWDEAHHLGAAGWARVHDHFGQSYHIGLSATPQRLDGKGLDDRFDYLVPGPPPGWLIDNGHLAQYQLFSVGNPDMGAVHTRMGDFVKSETEEAMDKPSITGDIIRHWKQYASDKLTIGFAVSIKHSESICEQFRAAGISAQHIDGKTDKGQRRKMLQAFARGEIRVLFNVGLFAEGFDIAANSGMDVTVGCVIDAAPTQSLCNWLQRCGRALRPQAGHAIILDHAGNVRRHGLPCKQREWTLKGREKSTREAGDLDKDIDIRQCDQCYHVHKRSPLCPACGYVYEVNHRKIEEVDGELQQISRDQERVEFNAQRAAAKTTEDLRALAAQKGYKQGYADHVAQARERKAKLRTTLFNLSIGASKINVRVPFSRDQIYKMKPKELEANIIMLETSMKESRQINK